MPFSIGVPLELSLHLQLFSRYLHPNISGHQGHPNISHARDDLDLYRSRDVIGQVTNHFAICHFLLVSRWNRTFMSNRFRDIRPKSRASARAHTQTDRQTHTTSDVIFCPMQCIALDRLFAVSLHGWEIVLWNEQNFRFYRTVNIKSTNENFTAQWRAQLRSVSLYCHYITTHSQTPIFCVVSRVDKRYL